MPDDNDTTAIIKEFLDLWQKQFAYSSRDPESLAATLALFEQMQENYLKTMGLFAQGDNVGDVKPTSTSGVSGNADDELSKLRKRIKTLEARVAELESGAGKKGAKAKPKAGKKRATRADRGTAKTNS